MKKFLRKLLLISLPLIGFLGVLELSVRNIPNDYTLKHWNLIRSGDKIEVLTLGNSHLMYGVNPDLITLKAFNASLPAQTIKIDYHVLKEHAKNLKGLKYIIIPIDYYSFYAQIDDGNNYQRKFRYNQFMNVDLISPLEYLHIDKWIITLEKGIRSSLELAKDYYIHGKDQITCEKNGYFEALGQIDLEKSGYIHARRHNEYFKFQNWKNNHHFLEKIIHIAKENKWCIIMITPPALPAYTKHLKIKRIKNIQKQGINYTNKYDNILYVDLLEDKYFLVEDFFDDSHLGLKGANKLSSLIDKIIISHLNNRTKQKYFNSAEKIYEITRLDSIVFEK